MSLKGATVLVTGATGFIGGRLVERLILEQGAKVRALVRDYRGCARLARFPLQLVHGPIQDAACVREAAAGCQYIFHCAFDFLGDPQQQTELNCTGTRNLLEAGQSQGATIVHLSTLDVYGRPDTTSITEATPYDAAGSAYAESKIRIEEEVVELHRRTGVRVAVLQPTIVYGPFCKPWTVGTVELLRNFRVPLVDGGRGLCNVVYVDDVVDAMLLAATTEKAIGETFLISAEQPATWGDYLTAFENLLHTGSLVPMTADELRTQMQGPPAPSGFVGQVMAFLTDQEVKTRMDRIMLINRSYRCLYGLIPRSLKQRLRLGEYSPLAQPPVVPDPAEAGKKPLFVPDESRFGLWTTPATYQIEKARTILGYRPRYTFEQGFRLTADYLRWANLLPEHS